MVTSLEYTVELNCVQDHAIEALEVLGRGASGCKP